MDKELIDFEAQLQSLTDTVERMEKGDLSLEQSLEHFEKGIQLAKLCQKALSSAEQKVEILLTQNGQSELMDFEPPAQE